MYTKIFIRTFPSTEECELFESILQTRWPELIGKAAGVRFTAWRNPQTPHISTVIWEFPSYDNALSCHESNDYKTAWSYAENTTKRTMFIVEGVNQEDI